MLLAADGHDVTVYERSTADLAGRGAGLVAQPEMLELLRRIGRSDVAEVGVVARERITLRDDGTLLSRQATPQLQVSWDNLFRAVRSRLAAGSYRRGIAVTGAAPSAAGVLVRLSDGSSLEADLVIGADGIGSVLRPVVTGAPAPNRYAGYVAWRGLVSEASLPDHAQATLLDRFAFYHAPGSQALGYSVAGPGGETALGQRRYNWVWYRRVPAEALQTTLTDPVGHAHPFSLAPGQVPPPATTILRRDALRFLPPPFAAVAAVAEPFVQAIFDYKAPRMIAGRIVLLGDAAFVVRPHTAMGVAKAAGDALSLSAHLRATPLAEALEAFNRERHSVGTAVAAYGRRLAGTLGGVPR